MVEVNGGWRVPQQVGAADAQQHASVWRRLVWRHLLDMCRERLGAALQSQSHPVDWDARGPLGRALAALAVKLLELRDRLDADPLQPALLVLTQGGAEDLLQGRLATGLSLASVLLDHRARDRRDVEMEGAGLLLARRCGPDENDAVDHVHMSSQVEPQVLHSEREGQPRSSLHGHGRLDTVELSCERLDELLDRQAGILAVHSAISSRMSCRRPSSGSKAVGHRHRGTSPTKSKLSARRTTLHSNGKLSSSRRTARERPGRRVAATLAASSRMVDASGRLIAPCLPRQPRRGRALLRPAPKAAWARGEPGAARRPQPGRAKGSHAPG